MHTKLKITAISIALVLFVSGFAVMAGPGGHRGPGMHGHGPMGEIGPHMRLFKELDLTDEQKLAIQSLIEEQHAQVDEGRMTAMREAHEKLGELIHDPDATETQIREAHAELAELHADMAVKRHEMAIAILDLLTEEQRQKLEELKKEHMEAREKHHAPHGFLDHGE